MPSKAERTVHEFDIVHLVLSASLGEIFTFDSIQNGTLISDVFPVKENATRTASSGFAKDFALHTDDAFSDYAGAFLGLRCLRNPDNIPTMISYFDVQELLPEDVINLSSPVFSMIPNVAHETKYVPPLRPVLFGALDDPYFRINLNIPATQRCSVRQRRSYERFAAILKKNECSITLGAGDCFYIDNYRAAHGRGRYFPRFDGADRWYRRVYISKDLRAFRSYRDSPTSRCIRSKNL
jgi:alpha-ketoglutarate-dependent taurine dioxygenase